ncbi:hypothetical protein LINPERPRIM_LOCUS40872 [Linum perenne]
MLRYLRVFLLGDFRLLHLPPPPPPPPPPRGCYHLRTGVHLGSPRRRTTG